MNDLGGARGQQIAEVLAWIAGARRANGRPDTRRAAELFEVAPCTVRRWIREGLPKSRVHDVESRISIPEDVLELQRDQAELARERARDLSVKGYSPQPSWEKMGWTSPHLVEVVELSDLGHLRLVRLRRANAPASSRNRRYGARVLDVATFPNRFVAEAAKAVVLEAVSNWRVNVTGGVLVRGSTEAWLPGAPAPSLAKVKRSLAAQRVSSPRPRKKKARKGG